VSGSFKAKAAISITVHEDRDHPHAHIVLNRRSKDGEFFFLKQGHHFNYDSFREAMVEVSDRYGLRLEATRKLERGITTRSASDAEYRSATGTGQALSERERVGPELDRALAEISQNTRLYRGLAAEATRENQLDIAAALDKAATLLAQGKPIEADGKVYGMAEEQHSFDEVVDAFHDKIGQAERVVAEAPVERRAELEHGLNDIYRSLSHLSPIGTQSHTLLEHASKSGIYSAANIQAEVADTLRDPDLAERVEVALKGTGISLQEVSRRIEIGAGNAALERQWLGQDLKAIAGSEGFDLSRTDELEKTIDRLDQVHTDLGRVLAEANVLKDSGEAQDVEPVEQEIISDRLPSLTAEVLGRLREDPTTDPFRNDLERETLRAELEELVSKENVPDLAAGDEGTLEEHMSDRLDRLYAAKAYLQSDTALANSEAMEHVLDEIANEEVDVQRERHIDADGEKGVTHG
jgi:type IV secretion system T-DNA border endonuclease VirD2